MPQHLDYKLTSGIHNSARGLAFKVAVHAVCLLQTLLGTSRHESGDRSFGTQEFASFAVVSNKTKKVETDEEEEDRIRAKQDSLWVEECEARKADLERRRSIANKQQIDRGRITMSHYSVEHPDSQIERLDNWGSQIQADLERVPASKHRPTATYEQHTGVDSTFVLITHEPDPEPTSASSGSLRRHKAVRRRRNPLFARPRMEDFDR